MEVTEPYKFIGFGDIRGPRPYKFIGFRWAFISQTLPPRGACAPQIPRFVQGVVAPRHHKEGSGRQAQCVTETIRTGPRVELSTFVWGQSGV